MAEGKGRMRSAGVRGLAEQVEAKLERRGLKKGTAAFKKAFAAERSGMFSAYDKRMSAAGYKGERSRADLRDNEGRARRSSRAAERAGMKPDRMPAKKRSSALGSGGMKRTAR
jgi:hypothetical protein